MCIHMCDSGDWTECGFQSVKVQGAPTGYLLTREQRRMTESKAGKELTVRSLYNQE